MDIFHVIILSIVEGITEFLPISSTGHLVLAAHAMNIEQTNFVKSFEVIIQLGAILSVVTLYFQTLMTKFTLWRKIILAFLPSAIVGFTFYPLIKGVLIGNPSITVTALILGGILLIVIEKMLPERKVHEEKLENISHKQALSIGIAQAFSIVPGVSRAGATIVGGLLGGLSRKNAVEFSFLLAIPTMIGATTLDLIETKIAFTSTEWLQILVGFILSYIIALLAIKWLLKYVQNHSFIGFGIYRIIFGIAYYLLFLT